MDWTDFDDDGHTTLVISMITNHGRATPLVWKTVKKSSLEGTRNDYKYDLVEQLRCLLPETARITVTADRGFGDHKLYELLGMYGWDYMIRLRGAVVVVDNDGAARPAAERLPTNGRATMLPGVRVTRSGRAIHEAQEPPVPPAIEERATGEDEPVLCAHAPVEEMVARQEASEED
jgi:hypothetical protein